ncbi:MAG: type IX secretion system membrane protein PorP/SprF [Bacteroidota bacterium]
MNKVFYRIVLSFLFVLPLTLQAQQDPQFSQYMFNGLFLNPATAGVDGQTRFQLIARSQWTGYQSTFDGGGGLNTQIFTLNTPILRWKSGAGFQIINDVSGPLVNVQTQASYAYHFPVRNGKLSLGLKAGIHSQTLDQTRLRYNDPGDKLITENKESQIRPDMALGIHYRAEKYYLGFAANHLLKPKFNFGITDSLDNALVTHIYATAGYSYDLTYQLVLTPSLLFKSDLNTISIEASAIATYNQKFWGGLSFRQGEAMTVLLGFYAMKDNALRIGYAFDYTIVGQAAKRPTSHEFMLTYTLPPPVVGKKSITRTPRFRKL